ncbi:uncharacterized protein UV8b_08009 [Ustilaginoidea virens]|uniref:Uncharacterized protein n=1 Tax=Ustilaginoidea virens TaxID=1159556 RepID=A0A063CDG5_USTVR|nr:uncharacterized protein UV8b_08009 [Ustilaginoidea virens]QUC23768.1 hypothetical protein UV8b_08009 [Ustilaginoidea virens]GAO17636.1 hypothetical protein UVI_02001990 [Ustilaginoidea virens]
MDGLKHSNSGIPRTSRLPVPRSAIPKPASPTSTTPLRPQASRDSFDGGELHVPKVRANASRDEFRQRKQDANGSHSPLRKAFSRDQLRSSQQQIPKSRSQIDSLATSPGVGHLQKQASMSSAQPWIMGSLSGLVDLVEHDSSGTCASQNRLPQKQAAPSRDTTGIRDLVGDGLVNEIDTAQTPSTSRSRPRPSLTERTMETLAQVPTSPALSKRPSSFFDQVRPISQAGSASLRPGSSYSSESSARASSGQGSRPGSSAGLDDAATSAFRGGVASFKSSLSTISGTPRRASGFGIPKPTQKEATPSRARIPSATKPTTISVPSMPVPDAARSPSLDKRAFGPVPSRSGGKTMAARPTKPRPSATGLFKKTSLPSLVDSAAATETAWGESDALPLPKASVSAAKGLSPLTNRKSSAALREQIAKAKAAKRAASRQASSNQEMATEFDAPIMCSDGYGPDLPHDDPFNLRKGENPGAKVLQQRVESARTTGRLNIAALGLKEIPHQVMKMYDLESVGSYGGNWAESVDLTRLVAADNEIEALDDAVFPDSAPDMAGAQDAGEEEPQGNIFGGLETLDLHGNLLLNVPLGFRRLLHLTSLNLSSNRLENSSFDVIAQMTSLRDLRLSKNRFSGTLSSALSNLKAIEMLDVHGNGISALPDCMDQLSRLRILNANENKLQSIPFDSLSKLPLTELSVRKNKLSGVLFEPSIEALPLLQLLDASGNQLTHLTAADAKISLPALHSLCLSVNRLQSLPDMTTWTSLLTLAVDENHVASIPDNFTTLQKLRHADFASNDIRTIPPEIARMQGLSMLRLTGNPLRDRRLISASTDELKEVLAARLEPPPPYQEPNENSTLVELMGGHVERGRQSKDAAGFPLVTRCDEDAGSDVDDDFTTPPTSAPHTPTRTRSETVVKDVWFVKPGGLLDLSGSNLSDLNADTCSAVACQNQVRQVQLHHNPLQAIPMALAAFGSTLSVLSLAHMQLSGGSYLSATLELPALRELSLVSNQITSLAPLTEQLDAPALEKLDAALNRMTALPPDLKQSFPQLSVLLAPNNQLAELDPESIRGLKIVDVSSNDIGQLNPRLGLLGGAGGLQRLELSGNRFRVPRWSILERGTEATLRWLRGRLPAEDEEMEAWRIANGEAGQQEAD